MCTEEKWKTWIEEKWSANRGEISYIMGGWEKGALQFQTRKRLVKQKKTEVC